MADYVLVVGSINMDLVVRAARHPKPGETILGADFSTHPGGKGANQAVAAARIGARVRMIGKVGADTFGNALLQTLERNQVDTTHIKQEPQEATGVALITIADSGENTIVVVPGANAELAPEDNEQAEEAFKQASVLLLQLEIPLATVERAVEIANKYGLKTVLNPAPARILDDLFLSSVDYIIPNENELFAISCIDTSSGIPAAFQKLRTRGANHIITTLGAEGAYTLDGDEEVRLPGYKVETLDTTAAGDAFIGAFAVALHEGFSPAEAAKWGNAAGAIAVTRFGAQPSMPTRSEIEALLEGGKV
jgi:ribokinase